MPTRRPNPQLVKLHRCYSTHELALCLGVHKNTVRHWQDNGLESIDSNRPVLFQGSAVRAFLTVRNAKRKRPCAPGTLYCLRCREPRPPALGMVDYIPLKPGRGNLRAFCGTCETIMHRRAREADLDRIMPGIAIQFAEGQPRLYGRIDPSLNCDEREQD
jgi:hypothetical protein